MPQEEEEYRVSLPRDIDPGLTFDMNSRTSGIAFGRWESGYRLAIVLLEDIISRGFFPPADADKVSQAIRILRGGR